MYDLLKKNKPLEWNKAAEASFEEFKAKLTSTTILSTADFGRPFLLIYDASSYGMCLHRPT